MIKVIALAALLNVSGEAVFQHPCGEGSEGLIACFECKHASFNTHFIRPQTKPIANTHQEQSLCFLYVAGSVKVVDNANVLESAKVGSFTRKQDWGLRVAPPGNGLIGKFLSQIFDALTPVFSNGLPFKDNIVRWGKPLVFKVVIPCEAKAVFPKVNVARDLMNESNPRSLLQPHHSVGFIGGIRRTQGGNIGLIGLDEGSANVINTGASSQYTKKSYNQHTKRPKRHFSLGYKVILHALVFVVGFYYFTYALRFAAVLREGEALFYIFLGMAGVGVGIGGILAYGFSVMPP
ncbi:hypothetical protein [Roseovarius aestuarii]|uniref:Uncharacterized protein n=1 Tax=Roseovarius aestuarii TaxID=475083 RepID=A0A1X7BXJ0_9RHOB|nr:hypothetical protein [Roseovarius aestuarii]SMC14225.1 hypothetical protein ROA7745_04090 [Roseovarius aestuarii]